MSVTLARIIHDGSSRNRIVAKRDGRAEPRGTEAYLKQCIEGPSGETAIAAEAFMNNARYVIHRSVALSGTGCATLGTPAN